MEGEGVKGRDKERDLERANWATELTLFAVTNYADEIKGRQNGGGGGGI